MDTNQCKKLIKNDVQEITTLCSELLNELDEIDLIEIDRWLNKIVGKYGLAKMRLIECEDY